MSGGYDGHEFYGTLAEIQGYLAELRYIDTAMGYLEGEEAGWLQKAVGGLVTPGNDWIDVRFGHTFTFTKTYEVRKDWIDTPFGIFDDTSAERINKRLTELSNQANEWAANEMDTVRQRVEPHTWPQGSMLDSDCIQPVAAMHDLLETEVGEDFGLLKHTIDSWRGDAADDFASHFYYPFEHTLRSQKQMLTALMGGIVAAKAIAESTQHSLMNVAKATRAALREQLRLAQVTAEVQRQQSQMQALIIAGGAAGVLSGVFAAASAVAAGGAGAGGALWSASFSGVSAATQIATAAIPADAAEEYLLEGSTAEQLSTKLGEAITRIRKNDRDQHEALMERVDSVLGWVATLRDGAAGDDGQLIPHRPDIVDGVDADTFYLP